MLFFFFLCHRANLLPGACLLPFPLVVQVAAVARSAAGKPSGAVDHSALRDLEDKLESAEGRIQKMARSKAELQEQVLQGGRVQSLSSRCPGG